MAGGHFLTPEYLPLVLDEIDSFCSPAYYASMAAAWTLSLCFIRFPQETLPRLASSRLDKHTISVCTLFNSFCCIQQIMRFSSSQRSSWKLF